MLERLQPPAMRAFGGRRVAKQVLGDPHGEPEREDALAPRAPCGPGKDPEQRCGRGIPAGHASVRVSVAMTISGRISRMQR